MHRDVKQGNFPLVGEDFVLLAWGTSLHVVCDPIFQSWPPVVSCDSLNCLVASGVSGRRLPVAMVEDFPFQRFARRDHESVLGKPEFEARDGGGLSECEVEFGLLF